MSSEPAVRAARMPADLTARDAGLGLAGLIGVLDRADAVADAVAVHSRARARRPAASRPDAHRRGAPRRAPLRSVPQAPAARPAPAAAAPSAARPVPERPSRRGLSALTHRVALWGAGPEGEYLAWPVPAPTVSRRRPARPSLLGRLARRLALWGAGPGGEYLAWPIAGPAHRDPRPATDRPVVLREMPSTPTILPAAPSPAAALLPRGPASSAGPQGARPVAPRAVPVPGVRPRGSAERSEATGWPAPARSSPAATGLVRARGDPDSPPVRGSPPPARRIRSPGSAWSSFP
jgi:hypothetical protein